MNQLFIIWEKMARAFYEIEESFRKPVIRKGLPILISVTGFAVGYCVGRTWEESIVLGVVGMMIPVMFYCITVFLLKGHGIVELSRTLLVGSVGCSVLGVVIGSIFIDLTILSGIILAIFGGATGLFWSVLNIYYYQGGER